MTLLIGSISDSFLYLGNIIPKFYGENNLEIVNKLQFPTSITFAKVSSRTYASTTLFYRSKETISGVIIVLFAGGTGLAPYL